MVDTHTRGPQWAAASSYWFSSGKKTNICLQKCSILSESQRSLVFSTLKFLIVYFILFLVDWVQMVSFLFSNRSWSGTFLYEPQVSLSSTTEPNLIPSRGVLEAQNLVPNPRAWLSSAASVGICLASRPGFCLLGYGSSGSKKMGFGSSSEAPGSLIWFLGEDLPLPRPGLLSSQPNKLSRGAVVSRPVLGSSCFPSASPTPPCCPLASQGED
jgi:hypothetical protein